MKLRSNFQSNEAGVESHELFQASNFPSQPQTCRRHPMAQSQPKFQQPPIKRHSPNFSGQITSPIIKSPINRCQLRSHLLPPPPPPGPPPTTVPCIQHCPSRPRVPVLQHAQYAAQSCAQLGAGGCTTRRTKAAGVAVLPRRPPLRLRRAAAVTGVRYGREGGGGREGGETSGSDAGQARAGLGLDAGFSFEARAGAE